MNNQTKIIIALSIIILVGGLWMAGNYIYDKGIENGAMITIQTILNIAGNTCDPVTIPVGNQTVQLKNAECLKG